MSSDLYGEYIVNYERDKVGSLKISQKGLMTVFDCFCDCKTNQVIKLAILSDSGPKILGVMAPEGGKLKFNKKYSKNDLNQISLNNITEVLLLTEEEAKLFSEESASIFARNGEANYSMEEQERDVGSYPNSHAFSDVYKTDTLNSVNKEIEKCSGKWWPSKNPQRLFCDEDLQKACENISNALEKYLDGGLILLAVPFDTGGPFPLMPIFCFGESMYIKGKNYLVFCLRDGNLYF